MSHGELAIMFGDPLGEDGAGHHNPHYNGLWVGPVVVLK